MNTLLIFFAFPVAVIILSAVLQTILDCPISVASVFFAIFLVITFAFFDATFLIATIVYTILAFISSTLTRIIANLIERLNNSNQNLNNLPNQNNKNDNFICELSDTEIQEPVNYGRGRFYKCR